MKKILNEWLQFLTEGYYEDIEGAEGPAPHFKTARHTADSCSPAKIKRLRQRYRTMVDTIATGQNPFRFQLSREINPAFECMTRELYDEICQYAKSKEVELECWTGIPVETPEGGGLYPELTPQQKKDRGIKDIERDFIDRSNPFIKDQETRDHYFKPATPTSQPRIEINLQRINKLMDYHNRALSSGKNKPYHFKMYKKYFKTYQQIRAAQKGKDIGRHVRSWRYKDKKKKIEDPYKPTWETGYKSPEEKKPEALATLITPKLRRRAKMLTHHFLNRYKIGMNTLQEKLGARPTGIWDTETLEAILRFQEQTFEGDKNQWDGIAGPITLKKLGLR